MATLEAQAVGVAQQHIVVLHAQLDELRLERDDVRAALTASQAECSALRARLEAVESRSLAEQEARELEHVATVQRLLQEHGRHVSALQGELSAARAALSSSAFNASVMASHLESELSGALERVHLLRATAEGKVQLERLRPAAATRPAALPPIADDESHLAGREEDGTTHFDTLSVKSLLSDDGRYTNRSEYGPGSVAGGDEYGPGSEVTGRSDEGATSDGDVSAFSARSEDGSVQ